MRLIVESSIPSIPSISFNLYNLAMKVVLQKVTQASVSVENDVIGQIDRGYVLLFGVLNGDTAAQAQLLAEKIVKLRLFTSSNGKINDQSILDIHGGILVISQFTLAGDTEKGNRPSYVKAASPDTAEKLYEYFIKKLQELGVANVQNGKFGAHMKVALVNDGPVTLVLEK